MANLPWYGDIRITNLTLVPAVPGQITHQIQYTGVSRVFNTGYGRWQGTISFGRVDDQDIGMRTEAFIAGFNGSQNTTEIPLENIKGFRTPNAQLQDTQIGRYYNYKNRLILIHGRASNKTLFFPEIPINENEGLTSPKSLRIRLEGATASLPHSPDNFGPWVLQWTEALT